MSNTQNMRDQSRKAWDGESTLEVINAGSLQRIADAAEKMALRHTELIYKAARLEKTNQWLDGCIKSRDRTIANLKGQITKLKKKVAHDH